MKAARREPAIVASVLDHVAEHRPAGAEALAEGVVLGAYRYGEYKDAEESDSSPRSSWEQAARRLRRPGRRRAGRCGGVPGARPRQRARRPLTPTRSQRAERGAAAGLAVEVLDRRDREGEARRAARREPRLDAAPRFLKISHEPDGPGLLALVGKGITFDSGGLSLKRPTG